MTAARRANADDRRVRFIQAYGQPEEGAMLSSSLSAAFFARVGNGVESYCSLAWQYDVTRFILSRARAVQALSLRSKSGGKKGRRSGEKQALLG